MVFMCSCHDRSHHLAGLLWFCRYNRHAWLLKLHFLVFLCNLDLLCLHHKPPKLPVRGKGEPPFSLHLNIITDALYCSSHGAKKQKKCTVSLGWHRSKVRKLKFKACVPIKIVSYQRCKDDSLAWGRSYRAHEVKWDIDSKGFMLLL